MLKEDRETLVRLMYWGGASLDETGKVLKVSKQRVQQIEKSLGLEPRQVELFKVASEKQHLKLVAASKKRRALRDRAAKITKFCSEKYSDGEIASLIGINTQCVAEWRHKLGIPPSQPSRNPKNQDPELVKTRNAAVSAVLAGQMASEVWKAGNTEYASAASLRMAVRRKRQKV